ncbi:MAG TPA: aminotransferase class III-fold pyridoxal phosphate-dependent enzyme, partial [Candidatus Limnocylindrales bacterium]|nr:aminotransferase class III-fold pyridoxal phosphate-dependent enzyme [Candidatus Limnocylindrales bacterium]
GGLPAAAYGGRREIMDRLAPLGDVYQAGTLSGNPLAMRAGIETLKLLSAKGFYDNLDQRAGRFVASLRRELAVSGVKGCVQSVGSLMTLFFGTKAVTNYAEAKKSDTREFAAFFKAMLGHGVLLPPSQFEALFVSAAHTDAEIDMTLTAARESLQTMGAAVSAD